MTICYFKYTFLSCVFEITYIKRNQKERKEWGYGECNTYYRIVLYRVW